MHVAGTRDRRCFVHTVPSGAGRGGKRAGLALWVLLVAIIVIALVIFVIVRVAHSRRASAPSPNAIGAVSPAGGGGIEPVPTAPGTTPVVIQSVDPAALNRNPPLRPDPSLTPGDTLPVTRADICVPGYSKKVRNVPAGVKKQAYAEYGVTRRAA